MISKSPRNTVWISTLATYARPQRHLPLPAHPCLMMDIVRDMEKYCPKAVLLNYTNPMAMLCGAIQRQTFIPTTGLCHSVQGTSAMLAGWIGAPNEEITYTCAGINHMAWYIDYKWNGQDAYPLIHKAITERPEVYNEEIVRNEMYLALGKYVTESSGHNSSTTGGSASAPTRSRSTASTAPAGTRRICLHPERVPAHQRPGRKVCVSNSTRP